MHKVFHILTRSKIAQNIQLRYKCRRTNHLILPWQTNTCKLLMNITPTCLNQQNHPYCLLKPWRKNKPEFCQMLLAVQIYYRPKTNKAVAELCSVVSEYHTNLTQSAESSLLPIKTLEREWARILSDVISSADSLQTENKQNSSSTLFARRKTNKIVAVPWLSTITLSRPSGAGLSQLSITTSYVSLIERSKVNVTLCISLTLTVIWRL